MKRLGVDPGTVRVGLAVSDDDGRLASPLATLDARVGDPARAIADHATREEVAEIVIGLPLSLDGREHAAARGARALAARVEKFAGVPVVLWDERLTTAEATRALHASEVRGAKARALVDRVAATMILQSYLDARSRRTWDDAEEPAPVAPPATRGRAGRARRSRER